MTLAVSITCLYFVYVYFAVLGFAQVVVRLIIFYARVWIHCRLTALCSRLDFSLLGYSLLCETYL